VNKCDGFCNAEPAVASPKSPAPRYLLSLHARYSDQLKCTLSIIHSLERENPAVGFENVMTECAAVSLHPLSEGNYQVGQIAACRCIMVYRILQRRWTPIPNFHAQPTILPESILLGVFKSNAVVFTNGIAITRPLAFDKYAPHACQNRYTERRVNYQLSPDRYRTSCTHIWHRLFPVVESPLPKNNFCEASVPPVETELSRNIVVSCAQLSVFI